MVLGLLHYPRYASTGYWFRYAACRQHGVRRVVTKAEIIARLDAMERLLEAYQSKLRVLKYDLKKSLDTDSDDVVA